MNTNNTYKKTIELANKKAEEINGDNHIYKIIKGFIIGALIATIVICHQNINKATVNSNISVEEQILALEQEKEFYEYQISQITEAINVASKVRGSERIVEPLENMITDYQNAIQGVNNQIEHLAKQ